MRASGIPGGGDFALEMLMRGEKAWMNLGGRGQSMPAPAGLGSGGTMGAAAFQQLAKYVKGRPRHGAQLVGGKPVTTIGGEIDTQGMIEAS